MKTLIVLLLAIVFLSLNSHSQTERSNNYPFSIGPFATLKAGINASLVPRGIKNGPNINEIPDFGLTIYLPLTNQSKFGLTTDIAYSTFTYALIKADNANDNWISEFNYMTISPNLHIYGFTLGIGVGIPLKAKTDNNNYAAYFNKSNLAITFEIRLGAMIPVFDNEIGRVNILINGGYTKNGIYKRQNINDFLDQMKMSGSYNAHPAWLSFGLNYLLNLSRP